MSVEELISFSEDHCDKNADVIKQIECRLDAALHLNTTDVLMKYFYDYYSICFPDVPPQTIIECLVKSFSSTELFVVLHYVIEGNLQELGYI